MAELVRGNQFQVKITRVAAAATGDRLWEMADCPFFILISVSAIGTVVRPVIHVRHAPGLMRCTGCLVVLGMTSVVRLF